jgi:hypothetical protein
MVKHCCDIWGTYSPGAISEYLESLEDEDEETLKAKAAEYIEDFKSVSGRSAWIDYVYTFKEQ